MPPQIAPALPSSTRCSTPDAEYGLRSIGPPLFLRTRKRELRPDDREGATPVPHQPPIRTIKSDILFDQVSECTQNSYHLGKMLSTIIATESQIGERRLNSLAKTTDFSTKMYHRYDWTSLRQTGLFLALKSFEFCRSTNRGHYQIIFWPRPMKENSLPI